MSDNLFDDSLFDDICDLGLDDGSEDWTPWSG